MTLSLLTALRAAVSVIVLTTGTLLFYLDEGGIVTVYRQ